MEYKTDLDLIDVVVPDKTRKYLERISKCTKVISIIGLTVGMLQLFLFLTMVWDDWGKTDWKPLVLVFCGLTCVLPALLFLKLYRFSKEVVTPVVLKLDKDFEISVKYLRDFFVLIVLLIISLIFLLYFSAIYEELIPEFLL